MNLIKKWFFRIDLTRDVKVPFMQLIKGDLNTQSFVVTLLNNGDIVEVKDTDIITLNIDKPDGTKNVISGKIDGDGVVSFILDSQALAVIGICTCNIRIVKDGQIVTSLGFNYKVIDDPYSDTDSSVESVNDYPVLSELLIRINAVLEKANGLNTFYETNLPIFNDLVSNSQILLDIAKNKDEAKALIDSATLLKNEISAIALQIGNINELKIELNTKLSMLNSKLSEFTQMYKDIDLLIKKAIESEKNLQIQLNRYDSAKPSIDELYSKIEEAKLLLSQLKGILPTATSKIEELVNNIKKATDLNLLLVKNTESANNTNSILLGTKSSADIINDELTSSITLGQNTKTNLDNSTTVAKEVNVNLDKSVSTANATDNKLNATNTTAVATTTTLNKTINTANGSYGNLQKAIDGTDLKNYALKQDVLWKKIYSYMKGALIEIDYPQQQMMHIEIYVDSYSHRKHGHYMINFYEYPAGTLFKSSTTVHNLSDYDEIKTIHISKKGTKLYVWVPFVIQYQTVTARAWGSISPNRTEAVDLITNITDTEKPTDFEFGEDFEPVTNSATSYKTAYMQGGNAGNFISLYCPKKTQCTVEMLINGYTNNSHGHFILEIYQDSDGAFYQTKAWNLGQLDTTFMFAKKGDFVYIWFPSLTRHYMLHINSMIQSVVSVNSMITSMNTVKNISVSAKPGTTNFEFVQDNVIPIRATPTLEEMGNWNAVYKNFGLKLSSLTTQINDCNAVMNNSITYVKSTALNRPPNTVDGSLLTEFYSEKYMNQTFKDWRNKKTYTRSCDNGVWSAWVELITSNLANIPNGYAGLDTNGKISESVLPQSILDRITALENKLQG